MLWRKNGFKTRNSFIIRLHDLSRNVSQYWVMTLFNTPFQGSIKRRLTQNMSSSEIGSRSFALPEKSLLSILYRWKKPFFHDKIQRLSAVHICGWRLANAVQLYWPLSETLGAKVYLVQTVLIRPLTKSSNVKHLFKDNVQIWANFEEII